MVLATFVTFAAAVGMDDARLQAYEPVPNDLHSLHRLARPLRFEAEVGRRLYLGTSRRVGANCGGMSRALRDRLFRPFAVPSAAGTSRSRLLDRSHSLTRVSHRPTR